VINRSTHQKGRRGMGRKGGRNELGEAWLKLGHFPVVGGLLTCLLMFLTGEMVQVHCGN